MSDHDVALVQQFLRIVDAQGSATDRGVLIFLSLRLAAVIETPRYDLTLFKVHFGNLTLKANTNGEHVLRFEVVVHNTKQLRCGRVLDRFTEITGRLAGMVDRFATTLDSVDVTFIGDGLLDQLPLPAQIGATRVGGVDVNKPRIRAASNGACATIRSDLA